jgi:hypothetical protein
MKEIEESMKQIQLRLARLCEMEMETHQPTRALTVRPKLEKMVVEPSRLQIDVINRRRCLISSGLSATGWYVCGALTSAFCMTLLFTVGPLGLIAGLAAVALGAAFTT